MLNAKSTSTPLPAGYYSTKNTEPIDAEFHSCFQMVIGSLLYLMLATRPNIAFAVTHLSCHSTNPSQDHLNKALCICCYLIGTSTYSLVYNGGSGTGLTACTDLDWGSDPTSCLSQTGFYLKLADGLISWTSHVLSRPCPTLVTRPVEKLVSPEVFLFYRSNPGLAHHSQSWTCIAHLTSAKSILDP